MQFWINGVLTHTEHTSPYCAFDDNDVSCTRVEKPFGHYTMEVRVLRNGIEVARQVMVVTATAVPSPAATVSLTVLGAPQLNQPWAVQATPHVSGLVSVQFWINGVLTHTEHTSPYCAFDDNDVSCTRVEKPFGHYTMEVRVLRNGIEVARQAMVVTAT